MKPRTMFLLLLIPLLVVVISQCTEYKLEPPTIELGNGNNSPAQLKLQLYQGATGYYSTDGSHPSIRFDPSNSPIFFDNISVSAFQRKSGFVDSDVTSQSFIVGHIMADSSYRAYDGPPGSWTTVGNGYTLTLKSVTGNGTTTNDNRQVALDLSFTGSIGTNWSGLELNNNIGLTNALQGVGSVTLTFGDGSTLFEQIGPNPSGIYEFDVSVGIISFTVLLPYTYLPHWTNPSP